MLILNYELIQLHTFNVSGRNGKEIVIMNKLMETLDMLKSLWRRF